MTLNLSNPVFLALLNNIDVIWQNLVNVTATGNTIEKTGGVDGVFDAGASSTQSLASGDGFVEFEITQLGESRVLGLSNGDSGPSEDDINFGIFLTGSNVIAVLEDDVSQGSFGSFIIDDILKVSIEAGVVKYFKNGVLLFTSLNSVTYPILVDTSIRGIGGIIANVVVGGGTWSE